MYAVIETGGKQYRVSAGEVLRVEKIKAPVGKRIEIDQVLAVGEGKNLVVGSPFVPGARVILKVLAHGKQKKILVFKYKPKKNYRRRAGHRQQYTEVRVEEIQGPSVKEEGLRVEENLA